MTDNILAESSMTPGASQKRVVKLAGNYLSGGIHEVIATFEPGLVQLTVFKSGAKPKKLTLPMETIDALASALTQYKADLLAAEQAEERRRIEVFKEAMALAEQVEGIVIKTDTDDAGPTWQVRHGWLATYGGWQDTPDELLAEVQSVKASLDEQHGYIKEAQMLIATLGLEATITHREKNLYNLHIATGVWNHCSVVNVYPSVVLDRLKQIQRDLERSSKADELPF